MTLNKTTSKVLIAGAIVFLAILSIIFRQPIQTEASVPRGGEYQGTTTVQTYFPKEIQLLSGNGTLGSVIITGAAAGVINIYDATTSDATLRAPTMSSSSILVASFPASAATGTYTFDRVVFNGLYVSIVGTIPTSTITFRP